MDKNVLSGTAWVVGFVVVVWAVELVNWAIGHRLLQFGILPRSGAGLVGIPLSPFLHAGIGHAAVNTIPLLVLGSLVSLRGPGTLLRVSLVVVLLGGAILWVAGRPSVHVGASGLIFGYFGFLVARGWYERSLASLVIAALTVILYGGLIWGVLPSLGPVSWEGHLFGLLAGTVAARLESTDKRTSEN